MNIELICSKDMDIALIIVVGLIVFTCYIVYLGKKAIDDIERNDVKMIPKLYERIEIEKSKTRYRGKRNLETSKNSIILFIFIFTLSVIVTFLLIYLMYKYKLGLKKFLAIFCVTVFLAWLIVKLIQKYAENKIKKIIFDLLRNKYGVVEKLVNPSTKIVEGKKSEVGNIRHKYSFSYKITKYNCTLSNYYIDVLQMHRTGHSHNKYYSFRYDRQSNRMQYCYNLNDFGLKNINSDILLLPNVKQAIESLAKTKVINVSIRDEQLIIYMETFLNNYDTAEADIDTSNVELFYNKVVKIILKEGK